MPNQPSYYDQINPDIFSRIPATSSKILEIGCGSGALGSAFKAINPSSTYFGVEIMEEPARIAQTRLDKVWNCNIEENGGKVFEETGLIDALVYGDVLEHLCYPDQILKNHSQWLTPEGVVIACIPNVQRWSVLINLLSGQWPQMDQGIFDRTHLRWFTKQSLVDLFQAADLHITSIVPRIFKPEKAQEFVKAMSPCLDALGQSKEKLFEGVAPLQYVVTATKTPVKRLLISGLMLRPQAGMNEVRMIQPLKSVASTPGIELELSSTNLRLKNATPELPKVMIWQRQSLDYENSIPNIKKVIEAGYILISEFDDDPDHFPYIVKNNYLNFRAMHAVQVSTEQLSSKMIQHNPEVRWFDNCLEKLPPLLEEKWRTSDPAFCLRVFFGALNRKEDWEEWMPFINKAIAKLPNKFEFEVVHDQDFFDALKTSRKRFTPTCNYQLYRQKLSRSHIALMPLRDTQFNRFKSDLKFVESSGYEVASIASPTVYSQSIEDGLNGAITSSGAKVLETLTTWAQDPELAATCAKNARQWVKSNRLQHQQVHSRLEWYRDLYARKDELTESLYQRVPELKP